MQRWSIPCRLCTFIKSCHPSWGHCVFKNAARKEVHSRSEGQYERGSRPSFYPKRFLGCAPTQITSVIHNTGNELNLIQHSKWHYSSQNHLFCCTFNFEVLMRCCGQVENQFSLLYICRASIISLTGCIAKRLIVSVLWARQRVDFNFVGVAGYGATSCSK